MNVQPRYNWELVEQEIEQDRQRLREAIEKFNEVYGDQRPGIPGKTLLMALLGIVITGAVAYGFVYLVFSLPFGK